MATNGLRYSETGTGTIHFHAGHEQASLCGMADSRSTLALHGIAAWEVLTNDRDPLAVNGDVCSRCIKIARNDHGHAWTAALEAVDEVRA